MADWADYAIARLQKQQQDQRIKDETFLERQRIKKSYGTPLWHQVREIIKENCAAFNVKMNGESLVFEVTQNTELSVRLHLDDVVRQLHVLFDVDTFVVSWECGENKGSWELAVTENGGVQFQWGMTPTPPVSMAKQMLDALLFDR